MTYYNPDDERRTVYLPASSGVLDKFERFNEISKSLLLNVLLLLCNGILLALLFFVASLVGFVIHEIRK